MALSGRRKIAIAVAGAAGAVALGTGGMALADPGDGGRTELRILSNPGADGTATSGLDCPEKQGGDQAQAADGR